MSQTEKKPPEKTEEKKTEEAATAKAPEAAPVYRFRVPAELLPGVFRQKVGLFGPGQILTLPDAASTPDEVPNSRLIPLDEASQAWLQKRLDAGAAKAAEIRRANAEREENAKKGIFVGPKAPAIEKAPPAAPTGDEKLTAKQVAQKHGRGAA